MKRTLLLALVALAGLATAFLLPHARPAGPRPVVPTMVPAASGAGSLTLRARPARHAFLASGDDLDLVYELEAARVADGTRAPVDFALVFDRSGSMSGAPLEKAKEAAKSLVARLTAEDRLTFVSFGSDARPLFASAPMDAERKAEALLAIDRVEAEGGTNMSAALATAVEALRVAPAREAAMRRIVLLSDGRANEGLVGAALVSKVAELNHRGLRVSALGLGIDFDEDEMQAIADAGGGQYRYLRDADEVASALENELHQASTTAASGVNLTIHLPGDVQLLEVVGYQATRRDDTLTIPLSDFAAGELRRVVLRLHVQAPPVEAKPGMPIERGLALAELSYEDALAHRPAGTQVGVKVEATADPERVRASVDRDATTAAMRARFGQGVAEAAKKYDQNDVSGAGNALDRVLSGLRSEASNFGMASIADELEAKGDSARKEMAAAPSASVEGRAKAKTLKEFARQSERGD